jgi:DNA-binding transcriptional ArsR family regulator
MPKSRSIGAFDRINWARDQVVGNPTRKAILCALVTYADKITGRAYMKQSTLATVTELSRETVSRGLKKLCEDGFIQIREQAGHKGYRVNNEYLVLFRDGLMWPDGKTPHVTEDHTGEDNPVCATITSRVTEDHTPCDSGSHDRVIDAHSLNKQKEQAPKTGMENKNARKSRIQGVGSRSYVHKPERRDKSSPATTQPDPAEDDIFGLGDDLSIAPAESDSVIGVDDSPARPSVKQEWDERQAAKAARRSEPSPAQDSTPAEPSTPARKEIPLIDGMTPAQHKLEKLRAKAAKARAEKNAEMREAA